MKRILITGINSYIGNSVEKWLLKDPNKYEITKISVRNNSWHGEDFSKFDVIFHVAGIAHVSADPKMEELYYKINRDLSINIAKKAKEEGVSQFIFMSSIIVYGDSGTINQKKVIDKKTTPIPSNFYGNSKLQAENGILPLMDDKFKVVIVRPPMIYGKDSAGNYIKLSKMAQKLPLFPNINNERSMLHIDNLCEFIRLMIDNDEKGTFFPQNSEYVKTSILVKLIAESHGKKIRLTKIFNGLLIIMSKKIFIINKVFGNLVYEKSMSYYDKGNYRIRSLKESIRYTEDSKKIRN